MSLTIDNQVYGYLLASKLHVLQVAQGLFSFVDNVTINIIFY